MESKLNKLLTRQIKRHFGSVENIPEEFKGIINDINSTYESFEDDFRLLQNSIELSSQELRMAFQKQKQDAEAQKETIKKINEAISSIRLSPGKEDAANESLSSNSSYLFDSLIGLIDERNQTEEALRWNQSLLQLMSESSPFGFLVVDNRTDNILYFNRRFCEIWDIRHLADRMRKGELKNNDIIPDCLKVLVDVPAFAESCKPLQFEENRIVVEDEIAFTENRTIRRFSTQIRGKNDEYYGRFYIFEDITERKRAIESLSESETRFRLMADTAPVLIWKSGTDTLCDYFNQSWLDFTGRTLEQELGNGWFEGVHPEDYQLCLNTYLNSFNARKKFRMEYRLRHADGEYRWLLDNGVPRFTSDGIFLGFIGTCVDISENKRIEETLRNLSQAVEQSPISILITDVEGNIEYGNPKVFQLAGYEPEELLGKNIRIFSSGEKTQEEYRKLWKTILSGAEWKGEFRNKKKNGDLYWELESISAIKNNNGEIVNFLALKEDITERKKTEDTLLNERTLFRTIIDLIPDAVYVKDNQGRKVIANPKDVLLTGKKTENEILNKTDFELYPPEQAQKSIEEDQFVIHTGKSIINNEGTLTDNEGITHSLLISKVPLYDVLGKITGLVGVTHDITERKHAEEKLQAAHKSLSDILNAAIHTSIITTDVNGIITVFSKGSERMLGYSSHDLIGIKTPAIIHSADEIMSRGLELSQELGIPVEGFEVFVAKARMQEHEERTWTYIRKDGTAIFVNLIVTAIRDSNQQIIGFLGIANDITDKKNADEELKRISTRLAMATLASGIGVWELNLTNNTLFADEQLFKLFGVEKKSLNDLNNAWLNNLHPDDAQRINDEIQKAIRGEKPLNTEFRVSWPDESIHFIRSMAIVQHDEAGKPVRMIGTDWDITEQKENEEILLKARQEAEFANNAKSIFLANMSHEIRTPLNAIIGFSQLINRDKHLPDSLKEYNLSIISAGEHLLSLINDILELSKMEAGRLELHTKNIDLYSLFADIQMLFKGPSRTKHLQFIFETAPGMPQFVEVDDNKLKRIFINLIGNAIKFTDEGGIAVRVRVDKTKRHKTLLIAEIQDSGCGIAENEMDKLFKHFVQTNSGIKNSSGTGLGLALSRELALLMGGDIFVKSEVGKGSVFSFYVDIKEGKAEDVADLIRKKVIGFEKTSEAYRILVVDDLEENRQVVVKLLELVGFATIEAQNGAEAIAKFEAYNPHLILMDMRMPVLDGYEATRRIKSTLKGSQIPIVALTASSFDDERKNIDELGIQGHIRKPFRDSELYGTIGKILGVKYIFEDESAGNADDHPVNDSELIEHIQKLSPQTIQKMKDAVDTADIDLLIELINHIKPENLKLRQRLLTLANNYDYTYLKQILNSKEI
jgi:PAS domain S-box-containing protein